MNTKGSTANNTNSSTISSLRISPRTAPPHSPPPPNKLPLPSRTSVAGFVSKLFRMVTEAPSSLIYWSSTGTSFIVAQPDEFSRIVLPQFFKHNNFSSFVRQLNMYGFHKVPQPQQGSLLATQSVTEAESPLVLWEFTNENFIRGHPELLPMVRRRVKEEDEALGGSSLPSTPPATLHSLQQNILTMMQQQEAIKADLEAVHRDSRLLWNESVASRERHQQQQQLIDRILQFLATVFASSNALSGSMNVPSRANELNAAPVSGGASPLTGNSSKRQRLLLEDNPEFRKSVLDLINYSHSSQLPHPSAHVSSPAIVPLDTSILRDRVVDLGDTSNAISNDIRTLQEQLATFLDSNDAYRSRSVSPQPAFSATTYSPLPLNSRKRSALEMNADDVLFDDLLKSSSAPPPENVGPAPQIIPQPVVATPTASNSSSSSTSGTTPTVFDADPLLGAAATTAHSDDFDINTYFATDDN